MNAAETTVVAKPIVVIKKKPVVKRDSLQRIIIADSLAKLTIDSLKLKDSLIQILVLDSLRKDSLAKATAVIDSPKIDTSTYASILPVPYLPFGAPPVFMIEKEHQPQSKDELFYILAGAVALLGLIKAIFPKYFKNMFALFFQTSLRSKQTRDQLLQNTIASLLLNLLFVACGGIYVALVVQQKGWISVDFWWLILYSTAILIAIYLVKFLFLRFAGWVFNTKNATEAYIFIVFLSNKIIGIVLLPFLMVLAFTGGQVAQVALIISLALIAAALLYRYLVSLTTIRNDLNINPLHFFLYLCTIEVLPLLLIYKAAFNYIGTSF